MTVTINGTTGIDKVQDGSIQATDLASGVPSRSQLPAGTVLQVVSATYSTAVSTTSASFVTTNLNATITPTSATSKIAVFFTLADTATTGGNTGVSVAIYRAGSQLGGTVGARHMAISGVTPTNAIGQWASCYLDSPSTTSATLYEIYFSNGGGGTATVFRDNSKGSIILMEIAA